MSEFDALMTEFESTMTAYEQTITEYCDIVDETESQTVGRVAPQTDHTQAQAGAD